MPLKPAFLNTDFRHQQLALGFVPFLLWLAAATLGILFWRHWWGIPSSMLVFYLGWLLIKEILSLQYALAARSLTTPLKGTPGADFLLFDWDSPETVHKLKILPEDAGFIYSEGGFYCITTLHHDFSIPFAEFHHEMLTRDGSVKAFLFRFRPNESDAVVEFAAIIKYVGTDLKVAGDYKLRHEWASKVIESMKGSAAAGSQSQ
jgi:hypothetical protein